MPFTSSPISVKDAANTTQAMIAYSDGTNKAFARPVLNSGGNIIDPATADLQTTGNAALATIATNTSDVATETKQDVGNSALANISTNTGNVDAAVGAKSDAAASTDTGTFSLIALLKRLLTRTPALGSNTAANSTPVVLASDQVTTLATAAGLGAPADTAASSDTGTFSLIALTKRGLQSLTTLVSRTPALGSALAAASAPVAIATDQLSTLATATNQTSANSKLNDILDASRPRVQAATATMTRPADTTTYASGDLVANHTTAGSVTPLTIAAARGNDIPGQVIRGKMRKSGTTPALAIFRIHLFNVSPSVTNGDNGAFAPTAMAGWLGSLDVTLSQVFGDGCAGIAIPALGSSVPFVPAGGTQNIFALIEARANYSPANAEVFSLELEVV